VNLITGEPTGLGELEQREGTMLDDAEAYLRANPIVAVFGAVALGFAVGMIARSLEKEPEPRPMHDVLREIRGAISPFGKKARHAYADSSEKVREAVRAAGKKARTFDAENFTRPVNRWWRRFAS
jgi:hypothetical protein